MVSFLQIPICNLTQVSALGPLGPLVSESGQCFDALNQSPFLKIGKTLPDFQFSKVWSHLDEDSENWGNL